MPEMILITLVKKSFSYLKEPSRNQNWGIGVFTKGGGYLKGGINFERGIIPSAHYAPKITCRKWIEIICT